MGKFKNLKVKLRNRKKNISPFLSLILELVKLVVLAFIIVLPIHRFVFQPFYVVGPSMEPNFYDNEYLIIEKINYYFNEPVRGEIIIFTPSHNPQNYLIKRVIGLPGEKIVIQRGKVMIYNEKFPQGITLDERDYLTPGTRTPGEIEVELDSEQYYVLGDNRNLSLDSRSFGPISKDDIVGRAWLRGWPFKVAGLIELPDFVY